jgi:hypothetical protein
VNDINIKRIRFNMKLVAMPLETAPVKASAIAKKLSR